MSEKETLKVGRCILAEKPRRHRTDAKPSRTMMRIREIEKVLKARHGQFVPDPEDTDDRPTSLAYVLAAALSLADSAEAWANRYAPWIRQSEVLEIEAQAQKRKFMMSADGVAGLLNITFEERTRLGLNTIGACDMSKAERMKLVKQRKRERDRERQQNKRQAAGRRERKTFEAESLSKTRPWAELGISRRTWERRRGRVASVSRVDTCSTGDTLATAAVLVAHSDQSENRHRDGSASPSSRRNVVGEADRDGVRGVSPRRGYQGAEPHGTGDASQEKAA